MKHFIPSIAGFVLLVSQVANQGCSVTRDVTLRSDLTTPKTTGPIILLTKDSSTYRLETYALADQILTGKGTVRKNGKEDEFAGELKLSDIGYIRATRVDVIRGLLTIGFAAAFIGVASQSGRPAEGLNITPRIVYPTGGSSCPFVYAWNGNAYTLEGEAFGVGLGRALEMTTITVLPSLVDDRGRVRIRLTNERAETHYVNAIAAVAVETPPGITVYADGNCRLWPVSHETRAITAIDHQGNDITSQIADCDGRYWESESANAARPTGYRDTIELVMQVPSEVSEGSIVVHAMNTRLSEAAFHLIAQLLGNESLEFLQAAEQDSEMVGTLRNWLRESALTASLWNGRAWDSIGTLLPEANSVPFAKVIHWKTGTRESDTVRIRFTALRDVWKIDAIGIDASSAAPLIQHQLRMASAESTDGTDISASVAGSDDAYAVLLPGDRIDMLFDAWQPASDNRVTYAALIRGYLYEWDAAEQDQWADVLKTALPVGSRLPLVKALLRNRSLLLPMVYAEWGRIRKED